MSVKDRASRSWARQSRLASLPSWTNPVGAVVLILVLLIILVKALTGGGGSTIPTLPYAAPTTPLSSTPTTLGSTNPTTVSTTPGSAIALPTSTGGYQNVPVLAIAAARAAATALYTGNFSRVPLAPGASYRTPTKFYPSPTLTSPRVAGQGTSSLTFYFDVTPAPGATTLSQAVTVIQAGSTWAWIGEAA
jgi:hypothetical protein